MIKTASKRKGDLFMLGLDVLFFIAIIFIFWKLSVAFTPAQDNEGIGTRQAALLSTYAATERMNMYIDSAAKAAAYESIYTLSEKGGSQTGTTPCGSYAQYPLWTTKDRKCFPENIATAYQQEFKSNLRKFLYYPGLPSGINFAIKSTFSNTIKLVGTTSDVVTLPIIVNKDGAQFDIRDMIAQQGAAKLSYSGFTPDTKLQASVVVSPNTKDRTSSISNIVLLSTNTADLPLAIQEHTQGLSSIHYLIDRKGGITQLVPEGQKAFFFSCADKTDGDAKCNPSDIEDTAISVALVNRGIVDYNTNGCDSGRINVKYQEKCWEPYTNEQYATLKNLVGDIMLRRSIDQKNIFLGTAVYSSANALGPLLDEKGNAKDFSLEDFKVESTQAKAQAAQPTQASSQKDLSPQKSEAPSTISSPQFSMQFPINTGSNPQISSCWGMRTLVTGEDQHDGIDITSNDNNVYAVADGVVTSLCNDWITTNRLGKNCACSSAKDSTCAKECSTFCSNFGNNIIISHTPQTIYSRYSHLDSIEPSLQSGSIVKKGQLIGTMGNTGYSFGKHLDLKIYKDASKLSVKDGADNALCYFSDSVLKDIKLSGDSCKKYGTMNTFSKDEVLTQANSVLKAECDGITPFAASSGCGFSEQPITTTGDAQVTATINNIKKQQGLYEQIQQAGTQEGIDYRLILAVISQESTGLADLVSPTGCAGIAQFCYSTASVSPYKEVFGDGLKVCECKAGTKDCTQSQSTCLPNDPRFDATKSVKAEAKLLASNMVAFKDKTARNEFAIASYNAGSSIVSLAIAKTGKSDPTWAEVASVLDESIIQQAYSKQGWYDKYFGKVEQRNKKVKEITDYVAKVGGRYAALGGSVGALSGINCDGKNVKELGSYAFSPAFTTQVPNTFAVQTVVDDFAKKTYDECDGVNDKSTKDCLAEHITQFNGEHDGLEIKSCDGDGKQMLSDFSQFIADCKNNKQDLCTCTWSPTIPKNTMMDVLLFEDYGQVYSAKTAVNAPGRDPGAYVLMQDKDLIYAKVRLNQQEQDGARKVFIEPSSGWNDASKSTFTNQELSVKNFVLFKNASKVEWLAYDDANYPSCGTYKITYPICVESKSAVPRLSTGKYEYPKIRFALTLNDKEGPSQPEGVKVTKETSGIIGRSIAVEFDKSKSTDVSYYNVSCKLSAVQSKDDETAGKLRDCTPAKGAVRVLPVSSSKINTVTVPKNTDVTTTKLSATLNSCDDNPILPQTVYDVIIVPVDTSGNPGVAPYVCESAKDSATTSVVDAVI